MRWAAARPDGRLGLGRPRVPVILQQERTECGLAALAMVAAAHGKVWTLGELRRRAGAATRGMSLGDMIAAAAQLQLLGRPLRVGLAELCKLRLPAVLHWRLDHFVVLVAVSRRSVVIHDPARGRQRVRTALLDECFTGIALELLPAPDFRPGRAGAELSLLRVVQSSRGLGRYLALMLSLLLVAQVLTLVPPVATQLLIDEVVLGQDRAWLLAALTGLGAVMLAGVLLDAMRRWIALYAGTRVAVDCTQGAVRHLLRLPPAFLRERHLGDLMSKLASLAPIRRALTETGIDACVQLMVVTSTVAIMCWYSAALAAVSIGGWLLATAVSASLLPASRRHAEQALVHTAHQNSSVLESLRAADTVRALDLGQHRFRLWQEHFFDSTNAGVRQSRLAIRGRLCSDALLAAEQLLFLGVGVTALIEQRVTLGALFAFLALRNRLGGAATQLLGHAATLYMVPLHTRRLSDIVLAPAPTAAPGGMRRPLRGALAARALAFRYPGGPWVFRHFRCDVPPGAMAVVTGPSGCGKTTLLRLLSGAEQATRGTVAFDGFELPLWHARELRRQIGIVLQDDALFKGTIADNICGFDAQPDEARMREAALLASVWREIRDLPMQHRTPVGDMGGNLSGGQRQRIVLARALYRRPRLLFLDEATSHLDVATERHILDALARLGITVISVAHRPDVLARATLVIDLRAACRPHPAA